MSGWLSFGSSHFSRFFCWCSRAVLSARVTPVNNQMIVLLVSRAVLSARVPVNNQMKLCTVHKSVNMNGGAIVWAIISVLGIVNMVYNLLPHALWYDITCAHMLPKYE